MVFRQATITITQLSVSRAHGGSSLLFTLVRVAKKRNTRNPLPYQEHNDSGLGKVGVVVLLIHYSVKVYCLFFIFIFPSPGGWESSRSLPHAALAKRRGWWVGCRDKGVTGTGTGTGNLVDCQPIQVQITSPTRLGRGR